jgi:hypothetical protein
MTVEYLASLEDPLKLLLVRESGEFGTLDTLSMGVCKERAL